MGKITRRLLLGTAGFAALGGVAYGGSLAACRFVPRNHPDFFSLLDVAPDGEAASYVGRLALASFQAPMDLHDLQRSLTGRPLIRDAMTAGCATTRADLVRDQCALDFAEGRVVTVDGWLLSETEAEICAAKLLCRDAV